MPNLQSEADLQQLENGVPAASGLAFVAARRRVLASGQSVLQSEAGSLCGVFPDGRKQFVKAVEPPIRVASGRKMTLV